MVTLPVVTLITIFVGTPAESRKKLSTSVAVTVDPVLVIDDIARIDEPLNSPLSDHVVVDVVPSLPEVVPKTPKSPTLAVAGRGVCEIGVDVTPVLEMDLYALPSDTTK